MVVIGTIVIIKNELAKYIEITTIEDSRVN